MHSPINEKTCKNNMKTAEKNLKYDAFARSKPAKTQKASFSILPKNSNEIFKSPLLWRFIIVIVLTIASVQGISIYLNVQYAEQVKLSELRNAATTAAISLLSLPKDQDLSPQAEQIITTTAIKGIAVHSAVSGTQSFGEPLTLSSNDELNSNTQWQNADKTLYEFIISAPQLSERSLRVRVDSTSVPAFLRNYALTSTIHSLILTLIVSIILILAVSHWLLDPILFMRSNLLEASKNPEKPTIPESPFNPEDEIGSAIVIAQNLIKQNSYNLQQTKSSAENKIYKLAYFDTLTTLPNRAFFLQQVERAIKPVSGKPQSRFHVIAVDLDHFKDVNDSMGHNVGDAILRSIGKRFKVNLPESSIVSRTGEDEFAIMLEATPDEDSIEAIANKILDIIRNEPIKVFNENLQIRASAGIASFPTDGQEAEQLVKHADIALNKAKEDGRNTFKQYSEDFEKAIQARFTILRDLRDAMKEDQLVLFYQPQLDLGSGRIIGAEA